MSDSHPFSTSVKMMTAYLAGTPVPSMGWTTVMPLSSSSGGSYDPNFIGFGSKSNGLDYAISLITTRLRGFETTETVAPKDPILANRCAREQFDILLKSEEFKSASGPTPRLREIRIGVIEIDKTSFWGSREWDNFYGTHRTASPAENPYAPALILDSSNINTRVQLRIATLAFKGSENCWSTTAHQINAKIKEITSAKRD